MAGVEGKTCKRTDSTEDSTRNRVEIDKGQTESQQFFSCMFQDPACFLPRSTFIHESSHLCLLGFFCDDRAHTHNSFVPLRSRSSVLLYTMKLSVGIFLALSASVVAAEVPSLTPDNYDKLTDGKTVFIKFFAPW